MTADDQIKAQTEALGSTMDTIMTMHPDLDSAILVVTYRTKDGSVTSSATRGNTYATVGALQHYLRSIGHL